MFDGYYYYSLILGYCFCSSATASSFAFCFEFAWLAAGVVRRDYCLPDPVVTAFSLRFVDVGTLTSFDLPCFVDVDWFGVYAGAKAYSFCVLPAVVVD